MALKVALPSPLADYTQGLREVEAAGATLGELLADLDRRYPGIRFRMIDEHSRVRPHIKLFIDGVQSTQMGAPVGANSKVIVIAALSGG